MTEETKRVVLVVTEKVTYHKIFEIPASKFAEIEKNLDNLTGRQLAQYEERIAQTYIDFKDDWYDSDDTEIISFGEDE